jgi:PAS domain S-box-containing protein
MNNNKANRLIFNNQWVVIGIVLVLIYWFSQSIIDVLLLHEDNFAVKILNPGVQEIVIRLYVTAIIMTVAYLSNASAVQQKFVEEEMVSAKDYRISLINSSLDMIIATNLNGKIIEFNPAAEKTFGYSKSEVLGKPVDILYAKPSDTVQVKTEIMKSKKYEGEIINKRKNGENFSSFIAASPLRNSKGDVVGVMGISRDITDRKKSEETARLQLERLKALNAIQKAITASLDLQAILDVMLHKITTRLSIDAASVLLLNQDTGILEYISKKGVRSEALNHTLLKMGEGNAGIAALKRHIITIHNLKDNPGTLERSRFLEDEDFNFLYRGSPYR